MLRGGYCGVWTPLVLMAIVFGEMLTGIYCGWLMLRPPQPRLVARRVVTVPDSAFLSPVCNVPVTIASPYGKSRQGKVDDVNHGVDLMCHTDGEAVALASEAGEISAVRYAAGDTTIVALALTRGDGTIAVYGNIKRAEPLPMWFNRGDTIGIVGVDAVTGERLLSLALWRDGAPVDPSQLFNQ